MLNADDDKIKRLLKAWHDNDLQCGTLKDSPFNEELCKPKLVELGNKYLRLNMGSSGHFMVNRETEMVYSIKSYGVVNLAKPRGKVEFLTSFIQTCTCLDQEYMHTYWYKLHPIE